MGDSDFEQVENEPAPLAGDVVDAYGAVEINRATRSKIDLEMITIETFDGSTKDKYLDSGAYDWLERLKVQIFLAETLSERKRPGAVKCGVLAFRLTGATGPWYYRNNATLLKASFRDLVNRFLENVHCKLAVESIAAMLAYTRKFPLETYATYGHRLSQIAAGLNRGKVNSYTEQQALSTFINYAYPRYRVELEAKLDQEAGDATAELENAVVLLTRLAKSDGRLNASKRRADANSHHEATDKRPRFSGAALAATAKQPKGRRDFSVALWKVCTERGHTTNYNDRHAVQQTWNREISAENDADSV